MTTAIQGLSKNIVQTGFEAFSPQDVEFAKNRLIDVVGCALGGANASGNSMLINLVKAWGGKKEATILGYGIKAPAQNVAMANTMMVRSYDYETSGFYFEGMAFPCHSASVTATTALTMAEHTGANGKELLTALILGDDMLARLTAAADWRFALGDDSPWDCSGTMSKWGATAIAGRLMGLTEEQMVNAFGIVIDTVNCTKQAGYDGVQSFKLHSGLAGRDAILSVELASKGFTGLKDALFCQYGFFPSYFSHYLTVLPDILTRDLGKKFYSGAGIGHKYYPCCGGNDLYIECALQINDKYNVDSHEIAEVIAGIAPHRKPDGLHQPYNLEVASQIKATFNISYNIANVLVRKSVTKLEHFTDEAIRDPEVLDVAKKVKFISMVAPQKPGVQLTVKMKDGNSFMVHADSYKGGPGRQLTKDEIYDKFRGNAAFTKLVTEKNAAKALQMLGHLEEIENVGEIVNLLTTRKRGT